MWNAVRKNVGNEGIKREARYPTPLGPTLLGPPTPVRSAKTEKALCGDEWYSLGRECFAGDGGEGAFGAIEEEGGELGVDNNVEDGWALAVARVGGFGVNDRDEGNLCLAVEAEGHGDRTDGADVSADVLGECHELFVGDDGQVGEDDKRFVEAALVVIEAAAGGDAIEVEAGEEDVVGADKAVGDQGVGDRREVGGLERRVERRCRSG